MSSGESVLNFGAGPTIHAVISASAKFRKIVFAEYTEANKRELRNWIANSQDKFDWSRFFKYVAVLEGMRLGGCAMSTMSFLASLMLRVLLVASYVSLQLVVISYLGMTFVY